jgi:hypothetical protein
MDAKTGTSADAYEQLPAQRSPAAVKMDNLIRRTLRVSNPYDAGDVAAGLTRFYRDSAQAMRMEEQGLPFVRLPAAPIMPSNGESPSGVELQQATGDVQRDIDSLINNALLKDIHPELRGWQSAIESLVEEGTQAARFGLDPRQRDRTFAVRRTLGDYARAARFIGALTPSLNLDYRRFAQSLDEVSSMLLVTLGDSLARVGFGSGRFLLQAPASELQERREAVLNALRHLLGLVTADQQTQDDWPRAMHAYRMLLRRLDDSGNSDLRALFQESYLGQLMDDLIARAATPSADGLRALGSTAAVAVQQLRRMIRVSSRLVDPDSPPLKYFLVALQLFYEAFDSTSSGFRLLFISRPVISFYGLYGLGGPDPATRRLQRLILSRSTLAQLLDCYLACDCGAARLRYQILFDKMLYDLDRAIDFYALGSDPNGRGEAEARAATFGLIGFELLQRAFWKKNVQLVWGKGKDGHLLPSEVTDYTDDERESVVRPVNTIIQQLVDLAQGVFAPPPGAGEDKKDEGDLFHRRVVAVVSAVVVDLLAGIAITRPPIPVDEATGEPDWKNIKAGAELSPSDVRNHKHRAGMLQELCLQYDQEQQWTSLLRTMTPACQPPEDLVRLVTGLLDATRIRYFGRLYCPPIGVTIPPTRATSGAGDTYGEFSEGGLGA